MQRDETEEEIDSNLDQISSGLARIRMMGQSMNAELSSQQGQMNRIYDKTAMSDERLGVANRKLNGIMGKK